MSLTFRPTILATAGLMALTACTTADYQNDPNRQAKQGALLGALGGAVAGRVIGGNNDDRVKNTVAGAAAGAAIGGLIGNRLDKQEAALRQSMGNNVDIVNTGDRLIVTLPQDILFATDSTAVRPDLQGDLRALANNLQSYPNTSIQVIGHTDNTGEASYNQGLSSRRAQAVSGILISNGVSSGRIQSFGRGEDQPIASNLTPQGRQQNRRVEIVILPNAA
ncbi:OmpA family protein [Primorskyibacter marinus]|uniref:OmpA family protein n=1 Tax=Primorskyibacter marinus TaxID=1977320 RepID=UPI000E3038E2|nr:OmpA family protein [Primorskyibacter marinus]